MLLFLSILSLVALGQNIKPSQGKALVPTNRIYQMVGKNSLQLLKTETRRKLLKRKLSDGMQALQDLLIDENLIENRMISNESQAHRFVQNLLHDDLDSDDLRLGSLTEIKDTLLGQCKTLLQNMPSQERLFTKRGKLTRNSCASAWDCALIELFETVLQEPFQRLNSTIAAYLPDLKDQCNAIDAKISCQEVDFVANFLQDPLPILLEAMDMYGLSCQNDEDVIFGIECSNVNLLLYLITEGDASPQDIFGTVIDSKCLFDDHIFDIPCPMLKQLQDFIDNAGYENTEAVLGLCVGSLGMNQTEFCTDVSILHSIIFSNGSAECPPPLDPSLPLRPLFGYVPCDDVKDFWQMFLFLTQSENPDILLAVDGFISRYCESYGDCPDLAVIKATFLQPENLEYLINGDVQFFLSLLTFECILSESGTFLTVPCTVIQDLASGELTKDGDLDPNALTKFVWSAMPECQYDWAGITCNDFNEIKEIMVNENADNKMELTIWKAMDKVDECASENGQLIFLPCLDLQVLTLSMEEGGGSEQSSMSDLMKGYYMALTKNCHGSLFGMECDSFLKPMEGFFGSNSDECYGIIQEMMDENPLSGEILQLLGASFSHSTEKFEELEMLQNTASMFNHGQWIVTLIFVLPFV